MQHLNVSSYKYIGKKKAEISYCHSIQYGNIFIFHFLKIENNFSASLFWIAHNLLIAFIGIKQSLPTKPKGNQKICWWHILWIQYWTIECMTEPIHSPVNSWHAFFTIPEKPQDVHHFCKQHVQQVPSPSTILIAHWDTFSTGWVRNYTIIKQ